MKRYEAMFLFDTAATRDWASLETEVRRLCDRIGVMHEGRLAGLLDNSGHGVTQEQIMRLAAGEMSGNHDTTIRQTDS